MPVEMYPTSVKTQQILPTRLSLHAVAIVGMKNIHQIESVTALSIPAQLMVSRRLS